jgi:hypothetical protein
VLASGDRLLGRRIYVTGPLTRGIFALTLRKCPAGTCCNGGGAYLELTVPHECGPPGEFCLHDDLAHTLLLDDLSCAGDESTLCCPIDAQGQTIVVRGTLRRDSGLGGWYHLDSAALCAPLRSAPPMASADAPRPW